MREDRENNVRFESWEALIDALRDEYTISFKGACRILKASRSWVNRYVRPFVRSTYIRNNRRGDKTNGVNWVRMAALKLDKPMTESIWFNTQDFYGYIRSYVISCTKQTKLVPMTFLMPPDQVEEYVKKREALRAKMKEPKSITQFLADLQEYELLYNDYITNNADVHALLDAAVKTTERSKVEPVAVPLPEGFYNTWHAPHELKDYGDADETLYRSLFRRGCIRIELGLPDENGCVGSKIFYVDDPDPIEAPHAEEENFIVPEAAWQRYIKHQG